jgi:hypothetical protein
VASKLLETSVTEIEYNFVNHSGRLYMERGCCCDMTACIYTTPKSADLWCGHEITGPIG